MKKSYPTGLARHEFWPNSTLWAAGNGHEGLVRLFLGRRFVNREYRSVVGEGGASGGCTKFI